MQFSDLKKNVVNSGVESRREENVSEASRFRCGANSRPAKRKNGAEGGIVMEGVAQVIDNLGNPLVFTGDSFFDLSFLFASLCLNSHPFVCISNTYVTPGRKPVFRSHNPRNSPPHKSRSPQLFRWSANRRMACRTLAIFLKWHY